MKSKSLTSVIVAGLFMAQAAFADNTQAQENPPIIKLTQNQMAGGIFAQQETEKASDISEWGEFSNENISIFESSDENIHAGFFIETRNKFTYTGDENYGEDEYMFFIKGGIKLTDIDGVITEINAGEGVFVPKEWQGVWETEGYTKLYIIYNTED